MTDKISQLPWAVVRGNLIIPASHVGRRIGCSTSKTEHISDFAHVITHVSDDTIRFATDEIRANAAFIVKAVNHHDQLVQAVKDLLKYAGIIEERCDSVATDAARAALAAVEAQP